MLRRIVNTSLRMRVLVIAGAAAILLAGVTQLPKAPVDLHPEFTPTYVEVQTEALGLSAYEVEQLITVPLEADLLNGVAWLENIRSESVPGLSSVLMTFEPGTPLYRARQVVQERIAQAAVALPGVSKPPQMLQPVSSTSRTMMIGLSSQTLSLIDISQLARWVIKPRLMGVEGVANVSSFGHRERQLQVQVDPKRLADNGVTLLDVVKTSGNALWVSPLTYLEASSPGTGGFIDTPNQRLGIQHVNSIEKPNDLAQVAVEGKPELRLGDVADVVEDHQLLIGDALVDNKPGIVLVVEKLPGANTVDVTEGVESALGDLKPGLKGVEIDTSLFRPADYVETAKSNVSTAVLAALALVIALLAFAFYHWRLALVSVATILVSLTAAALVVYLRGASFNSMVLAGLALALGVVIDDAITGTQRVARRLSEAGDRGVVSTIIEATVEVRAILIYPLVFVLLPLLPVFFMGDLFGSFGRPLAITYALALGASMVTALTLTPALGAVLLSGASTPRQSGLVRRLEYRYEGLVTRLAGRPRPVVAAVAAVAVLGLLALPQLRQSELPALQERDFLVELEAAAGTSLPRMKEITAQVSDELRAVPGVRKVSTHAGRAISSDKVVNVNQSDLWVSLDPDADYGRTVAAVKQVIAGHEDLDRDVLTYTEARLKDVREGADEPIAVRVFGNNPQTLHEQANAVGKELAEIDGVSNLNVDLPVQEPALEIEVDLERAKAFGVKPGDVRRAAAFLIASVEVGQLFYDQKIFEVVVWGAPQLRESEEDVRNLLIDTPTGRQVRLAEVADVRRVTAPDVVEREGAFRRIDVTAGVSGRSRDAVLADVKRTIGDMDFPLEFRAEVLGAYDERQAAEKRLMWLAALAALGMLLLLQASFGSWRLGALFFLALPVALVGGVLAALAGAGGTLTIGSVLGLLAVLAIAARNGILLIRRYQQLERREGQPFGLDLVRQGATERFAPTLMTAVATALAFTPVVVLGNRPGYELLHPMGIVILGGLVTATFVNLFVTPGIYLNFGNVKTETEIDLTLFEEELVAGPPSTPTSAAPAPLAGTGVKAES